MSFHLVNSCCGLRPRANSRTHNSQPQADFEKALCDGCIFQLYTPMFDLQHGTQPRATALYLGRGVCKLLPAVGCWACTAAWWIRGTWPRSPGRWCTGSGCLWSQLEKRQRGGGEGYFNFTPEAVNHKYTLWCVNYTFWFKEISVTVLFLGLWLLACFVPNSFIQIWQDHYRESCCWRKVFLFVFLQAASGDDIQMCFGNEVLIN